MATAKTTKKTNKTRITNNIDCKLTSIQMLEAYMKAGTNIYLKGSPGTGKSQIVRQIAKQLGMEIMVYETANQTAEDIGTTSIPSPDGLKIHQAYPDPIINIIEENKKIKEHNKEIIKHNNKIINECNENKKPINEDKLKPTQELKKMCIILEEINRAPESVQDAMLNMISGDTGKVNFDTKEFCLVATGNLGEEDGTTITEIEDQALLSRFIPLEHKITTDEWLQYAISKGYNSSIIHYINNNPSALKITPSFVDETKIQQTVNPRTWSYINKVLQDENNIETKLIVHTANQLLPPDTAREFLTSYVYATKLNIDQYLDWYNEHASTYGNDTIQLKEIEMERTLKQSFQKIITTFLENNNLMLNAFDKGKQQKQIKPEYFTFDEIKISSNTKLLDEIKDNVPLAKGLNFLTHNCLSELEMLITIDTKIYQQTLIYSVLKRFQLVTGELAQLKSKTSKLYNNIYTLLTNEKLKK